MLLTDLIQFIKTNRSNGKRACFQLDDEGLDMYVKWAFNRNYLFLVSDENGISGIGIAYPLPRKWDGHIKNLIPYDEELQLELENINDLCILDWLAKTSKARHDLVSNFFKRFPNWENQDKWGIHYGKVKHFNNKYMNKLKGIN
ncbi:hypothetical protein UFOVP157_5 [uncultured Caudovirales phage]|uniref:Uncharacterized protein n=1 Tax=uncultured Caudovirales phage TaxID=2100421 RepID=A0A6J7W8U9_9CAUD|nr:hypothetical protein UFOVP157_5 [uncultured Caudovirales phage]